MCRKRTLGLILVLFISTGCAPARLYFKPASFPSPVPPGMVVEEVIVLDQGPPESLLKVAVVGTYKRQVAAGVKKRTLHLRFTFLNNQPRPVSFYPGEARVVAENGQELEPTLIEKTHRLAPGEPPGNPPAERVMNRGEAVAVAPHTLVQFDLYFDLPEDFKYKKLENFVTYFKFQVQAGPVLQSVPFTRVHETWPAGCSYYEPAPVRLRFGFTYID